MEPKDFPLFSLLNGTQLKNFLADCQEVQFPARQVFIEQGTEGDSIFFVLEGDLEVFVPLPNGREQELVTIRAPAVIGEIEALTGETRAASVRSQGPVHALSMTFEDLHNRLLDGDPATLKVFFQIARVVAHRLSVMNKKLAEIGSSVSTGAVDDLRIFHEQLINDWTV